MRLEVVRAAVIVIASGVGVGTATIAPVRATAQEVPQSREAPTFTLAGQIVDAVNERPIIAAVIKVPDLRRFVFSDVRGRFLFPDFPEGTWDIVVAQLGYHTLEGSVTVAEGNGLHFRLEPDPVALEEITAGGLTYKTRLARRRNRSLAPSYVLEGEALLTSAKDNVWDLVGWQHGFHFEGYNDFGCPMATIYGVRARVGLYIDDRAVRIGIFEEFRPQDFALVEVYSYGGAIRAYTQQYLDRMTRERRVAVSLNSIPGLCPPETRIIRRRGRLVKVPIGPGGQW